MLAAGAAKGENHEKGKCLAHSSSDPISNPNNNDTRIQETMEYPTVYSDSVFDKALALASTKIVSLFKKKKEKKGVNETGV